ncbi:MAG: hypothetical protein J2P51_14445 [Hyphomicrobiaceae bacterium]|nr:hypothetical protein [Hyphomicrobiaceae bacterium]
MRIPVVSMMLLLTAGTVAAQTGSITPAPPASAQPAAPQTATRTSKSALEDSKAECIKMWDAGTHMTKQEWANTCARIQTRLESLRVEDLDVTGIGVRRKPGGKQGSIDAQTRTKLSLAAATLRRIPQTLKC